MPDYSALIEQRFDVSQKFGDEYVIPCPNPDHEDDHPSCWVNVKKGLWVCYSCGAGGSVEDLGLKMVRDVTVEELEAAIESLGVVERKRAMPEAWLDQYTEHPRSLEYWAGQRGLSEQLCRRFRLGYDAASKTAVYPVRDLRGEVLGVVQRRLDGRKPKYKYPRGVQIHDLLFGYAEALEEGLSTFALVEGAMDALALCDAGIPALAQFGGRLSSVQAGIIKRLQPHEVVLMFDQDDAGREATRVAIEYLEGHTLLYTTSWREDAKDVADLSVEERKRAWEDRKLTWELDT